MKDKIKKIYKSFNLKSKKYFSTNILFSSYVILTILISLTLRIMTNGFSISIKPILCDLLIALLFGAFGYWFKPKNQFKYFFTLLLISTFLAIANSIYYTFYKSFLSLSLIESASMLSDVKSSIFDKLKIIDLLFLIFPGIFVIIHSKLSKRKYYYEIEKTEVSSRMFKGTLLGSLVVLLFVGITLTNSDLSRFSRQWNREYVFQRFGLYTYTINDFIQSLQPKINTMFGYDTAAREFREFYKEQNSSKKATVNEYTNVFEGKNLLVIHAESIQNFLIGLEINGEEITPNLNKLSNNSLYFTKFYPQITAGTSSDTEFTFETGLLPSTSGITFVSYFDREYETLSKKLKQKGYYNFVMHANNGDYWNRNIMYANLGYDKYYSKDSYIVTDDTSIGLGLSDKEFFRQSTNILESIKYYNEPFYGKIITLTNHSPFDQIDKYGALDLTLDYTYLDEAFEEKTATRNYLEGTEMGNYLKSAHYADAALGDFLEALNDKGILKNTIIVLYGDHEAKISKSQFDYMYNYDPATDQIKNDTDEGYISFENYKYELMKNTPLIIWDPNSENYVDKIDDVMGVYDLMPTLANMFNFKYEYAMGNDIFSDNEKIVVFPNGNFLTNKVYYNSLKGDYVILTDTPLEEGYIERLKKYSDIRLSVSNNLIIHDLIKNEKYNLEEEIKNEKQKTK